MKKIIGFFVAAIVIIAAVIFAIRQNANLLFNPMSNFSGKTVSIDMDMGNAIVEGITIPSAAQTKNGESAFSFSFLKLKHDGYYYKVYYQNESYKFPNSHENAAENFYGSWEDVSVGFKPVTGAFTNDSLRIVGNPRDEKIFYGVDVSENYRDQKHIDSIIRCIRNSVPWFAKVCAKAEGNGISIDEQLYRDAIWVVEDDLNNGDFNHRWKRNPRVGEYGFMLVVCDEEGLSEIPDYVKFIGQANEEGKFVNPFGWFEANPSKHIKVINSSRKLKTRAVISVANGIFTDESKVADKNQPFDCGCGIDDNLYKKALYEQFFSSISQQYTLRNIPVIQDVVGENPYTREEYEANKTRFDSSQLQMNYPVTSDKPCTTVKLSDDKDYITLINPGSTPDRLRKESTGIRTRVGFTYGKFRGKIKFPVMLNEENIWNGLTYAFWLIYSDNNEWNYRRPSYAGGGYIPKYDDSENPARTPVNAYSEIDIEIVKASKHWPKNYYQYLRSDYETACVEDATLNDDVMYCCTNWDLATPEPELFKAGIDTITYGKDKKFETMRWYPNYKALTTRTPMSNKVFAEQYYYYEIEWRPTEIIWRLGPSPDKMEVVGYMDDKHTAIPNNQMKAIVTQEYHYSEWWPPTVWEQGLIPYNKTDIEGRVYEIVVE